MPIEALMVLINELVDDYNTYCAQPAEADQVKIIELQRENEAQALKIEQYEQFEVQANEVIVQLKGMLATAQQTKAAAATAPVIEIDGVKYQVNHGAAPNSIQDIVENEDLQKEILAIEGQNAISKL